MLSFFHWWRVQHLVGQALDGDRLPFQACGPGIGLVHHGCHRLGNHLQHRP
jgi:hypothetical protein